MLLKLCVLRPDVFPVKRSVAVGQTETVVKVYDKVNFTDNLTKVLTWNPEFLYDL